jgi:hypothetical protein
MPEPSAKRILVVDVARDRVKLLATGQTAKRTMDSGPLLTPQAMVAGVKKLTADWKCDVVSLGVPAPVVRGAWWPNPSTSGTGWIGIRFRGGVRLSREGRQRRRDAGRGCLSRAAACFSWASDGSGTALVLNGNLAPLELAHLPYRKGPHVRGLRRETRGASVWAKSAGESTS